MTQIILITPKMIKECMPQCLNSEQVAKLLNSELTKSDINTKLRVAAFIAQCGHESLDFNRLEENLNYKADRLRVVFPKYFPTDNIAQQYAMKPDKIANKVYANRMGNGNEESFDGYRYRGRGIIMLTGKEMYQRLDDYLKLNGKLIKNPDLLSTADYAIKSAIWFWSVYKDLNLLADKSDMVTITKRVNGGDHGLSDRISRYKKALAALG
jgi:putative chitinase